MSDWMREKDLSGFCGTPGRARQTLWQLRQAWGRLELVEGTEEAPVRLIRRRMGDAQHWARVSGRGTNAVFELEREG